MSDDAGVCHWGSKAPIELDHDVLQDAINKSKRRLAGMLVSGLGELQMTQGKCWS